MASNKSQSLSNKLDDIKRMQRNWMQQRNMEKTQSSGNTSSSATQSKSKQPSRNGAKKKEPDKKSDADHLAWVVGGGQTKKKTSGPKTLRARSSSPARRKPVQSNREPSPPSSGKDSSKSEGSGKRSSFRPSSGTDSARSDVSRRQRPPSGKMDKAGSGYSVVRSGIQYTACDSGGSETPPKFKDGSMGLRQESDIKENKTEPSTNFGENLVSNGLDDLSKDIRQQSQGLRDQEFDYSHPEISKLDGESKSQGVLLAPDDFDKLADQIARRVRTDLDNERQRILTGAGLNRDSILLQEDSVEGSNSHTCLKCKQIMIPPDHVPTILVPCGHTMCEACAEDRIKCPMCRTKVESTSINETLQQIISQSQMKGQQSIVTGQTGMTASVDYLKTTGRSRPTPQTDYAPGKYSNEREYSNESASSFSRAEKVVSYNETLNNNGMELYSTLSSSKRSLTKEDQGERYVNEFQSLCIRCEAYENEEAEIVKRIEKNKRDTKQQEKQICSIERERQKINDEILRLQEKADILEAHRREFEEKCKELSEMTVEEDEKLVMVRKSLRALERQKEKVRLLARNFNVSLD